MVLSSLRSGFPDVKRGESQVGDCL
jgi:hypothetical protein